MKIQVAYAECGFTTWESWAVTMVGAPLVATIEMQLADLGIDRFFRREDRNVRSQEAIHRDFLWLPRRDWRGTIGFRELY